MEVGGSERNTVFSEGNIGRDFLGRKSFCRACSARCNRRDWHFR